ncbi:MAG TPA: hypothetical protein VD970_03125 [Acetobacteraceae bacterium]|nr:hypothetical protein [Acetobacteraceae bacterium]
MRRVPALLLVLVALPAAAQEPPACGPAREGQVACQENRLCLCRFERGGSLAGRPDRWAWDCGPLRPDCAAPPADLPRAPMPVPEVIIVPQGTLPR